jgi:hypothetical protein
VSTHVCLRANAASYLDGGGHLWVYLNWALGLRDAGCRVTWLEALGPGAATEPVHEELARRLRPFGFDEDLHVCNDVGDLGDVASDADLLLSFAYSMPAPAVARAKRSALVDIDPGLLQLWMNRDEVAVAPYDTYFTIGENVGAQWHHTPPAVHLPSWPVIPANGATAYTTVSHWFAEEWVALDGEVVENRKRAAFLRFADLPDRTDAELELALCLGGDELERRMLEERGWRVREAGDVSSTPEAYRDYIQHSRGEWSAAKLSCLRFQNAWISDRTLCYLASGKPAIVEHTGPSELLPDDEGIFRFRTTNEAADALEAVESDYEHHSRAARTLAEERFDAEQVVTAVLERALA